jgi:hypothetical protein
MAALGTQASLRTGEEAVKMAAVFLSNATGGHADDQSDDGLGSMRCAR